MFWDQVAGLYDMFENVYNGKAYQQLGKEVAAWIGPNDIVLECACGTGEITRQIAEKCSELIATDYSVGMLRQARRKCGNLTNVKIKRADLTALKCKDNVFDKVVSGNVLHLLDDPCAALKELERVCKRGGKIILPTYMNIERTGRTNIFVKAFKTLGAGFKRQFDYAAYKEFFRSAGYADVQYKIVQGRMPCAIAVIKKR